MLLGFSSVLFYKFLLVKFLFFLYRLRYAQLLLLSLVHHLLALLALDLPLYYTSVWVRLGGNVLVGELVEVGGLPHHQLRWDLLRNALDLVLALGYQDVTVIFRHHLKMPYLGHLWGSGRPLLLVIWSE